jgi:mono/diheme cytochrome c family protein
MKPLDTLTLLVAVAFLNFAAAQPAPLPQPSQGLMPNPALGKRIYEKHCASCHGQDLNGSDKGPPFLHPVYVPSHHGDTSFQAAVRHGSRAHHWKFGDMPPVKGLSADDVAHITAYVRQQQRRVGIQ